LTARIAGLTRYLKKGEPGEALSEAELLEGLGMKGDRRQGGERQISLLSAEARKWMDSRDEPGLCFGKFRENILIEGLSPRELTEGSRLSVGKAVLRVSTGGKHCYAECELISREEDCLLAGGAVFASVERGGTVCVGDVAMQMY
jgi:MOSC domain-containing protein YiiM